MIVSFEHNFIFIKTHKTAGTSMEIALGTHAGEKDIITPLAVADELVRLEMYPDSLPRNFSTIARREEEYRAAVMRRDTAAMKQLRKGAFDYIVYNHASAKRARKKIDALMWDSAFKFTIERHPYEKAVSLAWMRRGKYSSTDFAYALDKTIETGKFRNYQLYTVNGVLAVDFIIRYEQLADDVKRVEEKLQGIEILSRLPVTKGASRSDRRPAAELLTVAQKLAIQKVCAEEFALMGYAE
jgi:hypothetical protein